MDYDVIIEYDKYDVETDEELWSARRAEIYEENKQDMIDLALEVARNNFAETAKSKNGAKLNEEKIKSFAVTWFKENAENNDDYDFMEKLNSFIDEVAAMSRM